MASENARVERTAQAKLGGPEWKYAAKRTFTEFMRHAGMDLAALLTYFTVLAIAPTLLALFSLSALLLSGFQDQIAEMIKGAIASSGVANGTSDLSGAVDSTLQSLMGSSSGGTIALIIGIVAALWSASGFVKAFSRASNQLYDVKETRSAVKFNGVMLLITFGLILGLLVIFISALLNDTVVNDLLGPIFKAAGLSSLLTFLSHTFLPIWTFAKWPVILVLTFAVVSLLLWGTPNLKRPYRFISAGGVFAVLGIVLAVVALGIYMSTVASYSSYGAIGSIMAVLFALWVINTVLVLGATFDAEVVRAQQLSVGEPAEDSFELPLRGESTPTKADQKYQDVVDEGRDIRVKNLHENSDRYTATFAGADADRAMGGSTSTSEEK